MLCASCGKENAAAVAFCTFCGTQMAGPAKPSSGAASDAGKAALSFVSSLSLTEKIAGAGAILALIGFFLPFIAIPGLGDLAAMAIPDPTGGTPTIPSSSLSLLGLAKFAGAVYFILLGALASGALLYFARSAAYARKMLLNGIQVMIGSMVGPGAILALLFASSVRSVAGAGFWIVGLGYCCIAFGGLMTIAQLAKAEH
ncbi:MAG: hypothetical protein WBD46_14670 [Acidobacteriaceae bacterium]